MKMLNLFKKLTYMQMIIMQIVVIFAVMAIFRIIPDRKIASIFTTFLFISLSALLCYAEFIKPKKWLNPLFLIAGIFLFFIAIPLAITRFLNWEIEFSQLKIFGIEGPLFHSISNSVFIAMVIATAWNLIFSKKS